MPFSLHDILKVLIFSDFNHHHHHHHHGETSNSNDHGIGHHGSHHNTPKRVGIAGVQGSKQNSKFLKVFNDASKIATHPSLDGFNLDDSTKSSDLLEYESQETDSNQIDQPGDVRAKRNIEFKGNGKIKVNNKLTVVTGIVEPIAPQQKEHPK